MNDRELAVLDLLLGVVIIGVFGGVLYVGALPVEAMIFAVVALVFGAVWIAFALPRLRRPS